jgi:hypothetical protein
MCALGHSSWWWNVGVETVEPPHHSSLKMWINDETTCPGLLSRTISVPHIANSESLTTQTNDHPNPKLVGMHPTAGMGEHATPQITAISSAGPYTLQMNIMNELHALWHDIRQRVHTASSSAPTVPEATELGVWEFAQFLSCTTTSQQSCILTILECIFHT